MMKSLYSGVAGLKVHNQRMDVVGNNISNVNTAGYKASAVTFKDIFYQHRSYATSGSPTKGGRNSNQVGYGASLSSISQVMTQSGLTYSENVTDCAIQGEGFFQVMDQVGNIYYTRNGNFHIDNTGNLCDANGYIVLGVSGDPSNINASSNRINLYVPPIDNTQASVDKVYKEGLNEYHYTVTADMYGDIGNYSITILDIDENETPFATQNDMSITIMMDLDAFNNNEGTATNVTNAAALSSVEEFNNAIAQALKNGGIEIPGVEDASTAFKFNFDLPPVTATGSTDISGDPSVNQVLAKQASAQIDHTFTAGANPTTAQLTFTANDPGDYANKYEINLTASTTVTAVTARWNEDVLTVTVPAGTAPDAAAIQAAINSASNSSRNRTEITVTGSLTADQTQELADKSTTLRAGFSGGRDNFFKRVAETMDTVKLTGGHLAADQTTKDLENIIIDDDGVIYGVHAVHGTIAMGRIDLAVFENPEGLDQVGTSYWQESLSSGQPEVKKPNEAGSGSVVSTALEMSNADLSQEISDMIITQRGFQANSRVITVTDTMLEELVNLKR